MVSLAIALDGTRRRNQTPYLYVNYCVMVPLSINDLVWGNMMLLQFLTGAPGPIHPRYVGGLQTKSRISS